MRIERAVNYIETLGPGRRLAVWVNGCSRACPGCVSERLQKVDEATETDIEEYFFGYRLDACDGVTVSGGEPFEQIPELLHLVDYFLSRGVRDILVYTGYTLKELREKNDPQVREILRKIAALIDGPYVAALDSGKGNLMGSTNQCLHIFAEEFRAAYEGYMREERRMQEMPLPGALLAVGIPDTAYIKAFREKKP